MEKSIEEQKFERLFEKYFPSINTSGFRFGNENKVNFSQYLIPPQNNQLIDSKYFLAEEKTNSLLHFTKLKSLESIIQTKSIWMYNLHKMNDPREYSYCEGHLFPRKDFLNDAKDNFYVLSMVSPNIKRSTKFNMWRLYGDNGKGCVIELDFSINSNRFWHEFYMSEILYGYKNKKGVLALSKFLSKHLSLKLNAGQLSCFHKSGLFRLEEEVRLLYDGREKKGTGPKSWSSYQGEKLFPMIKKESGKKKYLILPIYTENCESISSEIPYPKIKSITLGYGIKNITNKKKVLEGLCLEYLGYVPQIKSSILRKTYWG